MNSSPPTSSPETVLLKLDEIVPYWRNPRQITEEAVNALAMSITEYGYQQPIVVDADKVIIIGHTRYAAVRKLRWTEVPVIIKTDLDPLKVKELRILDNRSGEYTSWDFTALIAELESLDSKLMRTMFPEADIIEDDGPSIDWNDAPTTVEVEPVVESAEFICPSCFHTWTMDIDETQVRLGLLKVVA